MTTIERPRVMTAGMMVLFAVAGGAAIGNLYYAQPLLAMIADDLHVSDGTAGILITATQVGYAVGIMSIVPLGDIRNRRRLVTVMMLLAAASLLACSIAPNIAVLALTSVALGLTTVSGQILLPLAGDLAEPASRGRIVGTITSGVLTGILVARIVSGTIAHLTNWRIVFVFAGLLSLLLALLVRRSLPETPPKTSHRYLPLLVSVFSLVRTEPVLRRSMVFGTLSLGTFTMFWTTLTFLLSDPPYGYSTQTIGLFSLIGLIGTLLGQVAGRLHDRGWSAVSTGASWLLVVIAWVIAAFGHANLVLLIIAIVVLDIGTQGQRILNQAQIFAISHEARSRTNTAYVTGNFIGGALGSILAATLWTAGGWTLVCIVAGSLSAVALAVWAFSIRWQRPLAFR